MSLQSEAAHPAEPRPTPFLENIIRFLMPYFLPVTDGAAEARTEILETLLSYGATTRSALLNAAQAIAFGFASLDTLKEAKDPELSASMRLRYRGCANNLTRSAHKAEHFLNANRLVATPAADKRPSEPVNDTTDADAEAAITFAKSYIAQQRQKADHHHNARHAKPQPPRPSASPPELRPRQQPERNNPLGSASHASPSPEPVPSTFSYPSNACAQASRIASESSSYSR